MFIKYAVSSIVIAKEHIPCSISEQATYSIKFLTKKINFPGQFGCHFHTSSRDKLQSYSAVIF